MEMWTLSCTVCCQHSIAVAGISSLARDSEVNKLLIRCFRSCRAACLMRHRSSEEGTAGMAPVVGVVPPPHDAARATSCHVMLWLWLSPCRSAVSNLCKFDIPRRCVEGDKSRIVFIDRHT